MNTWNDRLREARESDARALAQGKVACCEDYTLTLRRRAQAEAFYGDRFLGLDETGEVRIRE